MKDLSQGQLKQLYEKNRDGYFAYKLTKDKSDDVKKGIWQFLTEDAKTAIKEVLRNV